MFLLHLVSLFLRTVNALRLILQPIYVVIYVAFFIGAYVWLIYPSVPQSMGGGRPEWVQLVVNLEKLPKELTDSVALLGTSRAQSNPTNVPSPAPLVKSGLSNPVKLLYRTSDLYYVKVPTGEVIALSKGAVDGLLLSSAQVN